jgi:hypothetical protein
MLLNFSPSTLIFSIPTAMGSAMAAEKRCRCSGGCDVCPIFKKT